MSSDRQAKFVGVSIIQGQLALGVVVGKSDLIDILIADREAAELAIQIIRHLRDATASPPAIEQAAALAMLRMREAREALEALARVQDDERRALAAEMAARADSGESTMLRGEE